MADETVSEEPEQAKAKKKKEKKPKGEKKKGGKKKLIILVILLLGGGFAAKTFLLGGGAPAKADAPKLPGEIIEIDPLTVNLADAGLHYARVGLAVVLVEGVAPDPVNAHIALLKDATISIVGKYESAELATSKGQNQLRKQLTKKAQELFEGDVVLKVVLTELVVQ